MSHILHEHPIRTYYPSTRVSTTTCLPTYVTTSHRTMLWEPTQQKESVYKTLGGC